MTKITNKGRELALKLKQVDLKAQEICSLICRASKSYHNVQEGHCNGHPAMSNPHVGRELADKLQGKFEAYLERREEQLEVRITTLAMQLKGVVSVDFSGDPRGACVKLVHKNRALHDAWGHDGVCVP